jgi:hypothetical protein
MGAAGLMELATMAMYLLHASFLNFTFPMVYQMT